MRLLFILIYNVFCQDIAMVFSAAKVNRQDELAMGPIHTMRHTEYHIPYRLYDTCLISVDALYNMMYDSYSMSHIIWPIRYDTAP